MTRLALPLFALLLAAGEARAQEELLTLRGVVVGVDGSPVPGAEVLLHRLTQEAGSRVAVDTTGVDGDFGVEVRTTPGAVHFAAVRYAGALFVGPILEDGGAVSGSYRIVVSEVVEEGAVVLADGTRLPAAEMGPPGVGPGGGAVSAAARTMPDPPSPRAVLAVLLAIGVALTVAAATLLRSRRERARRHIMVELATLEETRASSGELGESDAAAARELREALRGLAG